jgi:hypothetical protein
MKKAKPAKRAKAKKRAPKPVPAPMAPPASSGRVDSRWHDRRSIDHSVGRNENGLKMVITMLQFCQQWPYAIIDILGEVQIPHSSAARLDSDQKMAPMTGLIPFARPRFMETSIFVSDLA